MRSTEFDRESGIQAMQRRSTANVATSLRMRGPGRLTGAVRVSGAKNAALPILAATILADGEVALEAIPDVGDVATMRKLLDQLGVSCRQGPGGELRVETVDDSPAQARYDLVRRMRASFCVLGPMLARRGRAIVALPGGCRIGPRPVDMHLRGLEALGASVRLERGYVVANARQLRGAELCLTGPHGPSVTATANVLSAAVLAQGKSVLRGAALEPEIVDLGEFLIGLGATIQGLGTSTLEVVGAAGLHGGRHRVIPDRIEAATLAAAVAATGGNARIENIAPVHLRGVVELLESAGAIVRCEEHALQITADGPPRPLDFAATPYPGAPTDVQAQLTAVCCLARGASRIRDLVFPQRFAHAAELARLGARIDIRAGEAIVNGVPRLTGADVAATDLRGGAALVIAGLAASGATTVRGVAHLDRGYERLDEKLRGLGASIERCE